LEIVNILAFAGTLAAVNAAPGPVTAIILSRSLGNDIRGGAAFALGVGCADIAALLLVWGGLEIAAQGHPEVLTALRWLGGAYLLWLAAGMWQASPPPDFGPGHGTGRLLPCTLAGIATCLCNPHTLLFFVALLPGVMPVEHLDMAGLAVLVAVSMVVNSVMFGLLICLGARMRPLITGPENASLLNRTLAVLLGGAAIWLAVAA
jgi:threonine/homoserine/homoserine lactone efflux protein